jgi:hypothetical protein
MERADLGYALAAVSGLFALLVLAKGWLGRALARRRSRLRNRRAIRGERRAEVLLERLGYTILERQAPAVWTVVCDGAEHDISLRADLLVSKNGDRFVAEVKTGQLAPRLTTSSTRRQLLEYRVAYDVDGVLLVDAEQDRVMAVDFPLAPRPAAPRSGPTLVISAFCAGAALGAVAALWLALK